MTAPAFPFLHHDFGVEILDVDLHEEQCAAAWQALRDSLARHSLLVLRKQKLTHEAMQRVALAFGTRHGEVQRVETRGPAEHQDWYGAEDRASPAMVIVLCARESPTQDGGMEFASASAVSAMPAVQKPSRCAALRAPAPDPDRIYHHDFRPDDVLIWNAGSLTHRACALKAGERRVLEEIAAYAA